MPRQAIPCYLPVMSAKKRGRPVAPRYLPAIERAVEAVGSQAALAEAIGITRQALEQALSGARPFPEAWCRKAAAATRGKVRPADFRPDLFP